VSWIQLSRDREQWRGFVNKLRHTLVSEEWGISGVTRRLLGSQ
jgi:hypothetical protein